MTRHLALATFILTLACLTAHADDVILFSAAQAGADAWSWSTARIKEGNGTMIVKEKNPDGDYGDVFLSENFPFFANGKVIIDAGTINGTYTLQILAFNNENYLTSIDALKDIADGGTRVIDVSALDLPPNTDAVTFKLWVGSAPDASMELNELQYVIPVASDRVLLDKTIDSMSIGEPDKLSWDPTMDGGVLTLTGENEYGSVLFPDLMPRPDTEGYILVDAPQVKDGTYTIQAVLFDENRDYLESIDIITAAGPGISARTMDTTSWPAAAAAFRLKIWLGGKPGASAEIRRVVVVR